MKKGLFGHIIGNFGHIIGNFGHITGNFGHIIEKNGHIIAHYQHLTPKLDFSEKWQASVHIITLSEVPPERHFKETAKQLPNQVYTLSLYRTPQKTYNVIMCHIIDKLPQPAVVTGCGNFGVPENNNIHIITL